jgi:transposase
MDGRVGELRERWQQRTETAFERMFAGKSDEELRTLAQRETMAELIGRELSAILLEEHVATDATARPSDGLAARCPKCGQAGQRAVEREKLPPRSVVTRVGQIEIRRQRWRCAKCRISAR